MDTSALGAYIALTSFPEVAKSLATHQNTINLLSFAIAAFTGLMMWLAGRHIKSERWMLFFAGFFTLLAGRYLWTLGFWLPAHLANPAVEPHAGSFVYAGGLQFLSIANNLFALAAANDIAQRRPRIPRRWIVVACIAFVTTIAASVVQAKVVIPGLLYPYEENKLFYELLRRGVDSLFSAYCLYKVGYAILKNFRRRLWVASLAFFVALIYAVLHIIYGLSPLLAPQFLTTVETQSQLDLFDAFLVTLALPLKFLLATFTFLLVMLFFENLYDLMTLQNSMIEKRQDYLSTAGIAQHVGEKVRVKKRRGWRRQVPDAVGFVNLTIRLPGEDKKRVACIIWPNNSPEPQRAEVFDWNFAENQFSSMLYEGYEDIPKGLDLKRVFPFLPYVGRVLKREKEMILPKLGPGSRPGAESYGNIQGMINIAILAHGAAIGCLQLVRFEAPFSQMAVRQVREIAKLISPAVQAYRELAGLDQMSISFTVKQASAEAFSPEKAIEAIAEIIHDIFSPTLTYLNIDFGFCTESAVKRAAKDAEYVIKDLEKEIAAARLAARAALEREVGEQDLEKEVDTKQWDFLQDIFEDGKSVERRLLRKRLTARVTETLSKKPPDSPSDRFIAGVLLIAVSKSKDDYAQPSLGTTYLHRKTASTLVADAYLDFARDYFNDLLKTLGTELSEKRLNIGEWFKPIEEVLTQKAKLSWVLVGQQSREEKIGSREGLRVLGELEDLTRECRKILSRDKETEEHKEKETGEHKEKEIGVHYVLKSPQAGAHHVLRLELNDAEATMWLGVEREYFGSELEFSSPWKNFLVNLIQIADASLTRISFPEKFRPHLEAAQVQGIIASMATAALVSHQFRNLIENQSISIRALLNAAQQGHLKTDNERLDKMLITMKDSTVRMREIFQYLDHVVKMDEHRPCRLADAAHHASKLYELSLLHKKISCDIRVPPDIFVDVPYNVAALALANLVGNAKDAVSEEDGRIWIEATLEGDSVLCSVHDNGKGVSPELRRRIFDPKESTKQYGGGIGLYLTKHSLSENGSSIMLTESGEAGSVFTIRFPLSKEVATV